MSSETAIEQEQELSDADRLFATAEFTTDDGHVLAQIMDWERVETDAGPRVAVELLLPSGRRRTVRYKWPEADSRRYQFVRLVEQTGWDLKSADQIVGERVPCTVSNGDTQIHIEHRVTERVRDFFVHTGPFVFILGSILAGIMAATWLMLIGGTEPVSPGVALLSMLAFGFFQALGGFVGLLVSIAFLVILDALVGLSDSSGGGEQEDGYDA